MTKQGEKIINTINGYLSSWIEDTFDIEVDCRNEIDFALHCDDDGNEIIGWSLFSMPDIENIWRFYMRKYLNKDIHEDCIWALSLLHEVAHIMTLDNFSIEEQESDCARKVVISTIPNKIERNLAYFDLPTERAATEWAVAYLEAHENEVWEMQQKVMKYFCEFYEVEGIEEDVA